MLAPDTQHVARGDAYAACQRDRFPEPFNSYAGNTFEDALRNRMGCCGIRAAQDDDELLAAISAYDI
jgi:hypothetical protein